MISQPIRGYFNSVQTIIYDNKRQALYALVGAQSPDYSQNMKIYFIISRDNGETWSYPIDINSSNFANRGFQTMALDEKNGNLAFGWYDGRNDPTFMSMEYFGAMLSAKELDKLVCGIPLSNPLFSILPATLPSITDKELKPEVKEARVAAAKKRFERRFGDRMPKGLDKNS